MQWGLGGIEAFFLGSVARKVSVRSSKSVIIAKLPSHKQPDVLKVLFATDGSDYSRDTGEFLSKMPFYDNTEIRILNVTPLEVMDMPQTFAPDIIEEIIQIEEKIRETRINESKRILEDSKELLGNRFGNIDVLWRVGDPSREILRTAETLRSNLIAVGCRGLKGIKGMMGSISRNIVIHAECSILIGKTCND